MSLQSLLRYVFATLLGTGGVLFLPQTATAQAGSSGEGGPAETASPPERPAASTESDREQLEWLEGFAVSGYVQPQLKVEDAGNDSDVFFGVRRGRVGTTYSFDWAEFEVEIDAVPDGVTLKDAKASFRIPTPDWTELELTLGQFKMPFGYEVQNSSSERLWPERSRAARRIFPGERDVGIVVGATVVDAVAIQLAAVNGVPLGDAFRETFPNFEPDRHKDFMARVGYESDWLTVGLSGLYGHGTRPAVAEMDDPMTPVDETERFGFGRFVAGADARFVHQWPVLGRFVLQGEFYGGRNMARKTAAEYPVQVAGDVEDRDFVGWYVGAVQWWGDYVAFGGRVQQYLPDFQPNLTLAEPVLLVFPTEGTRLTFAWQLDTEEPDDNQGWLRAQVKF